MRLCLSILCALAFWTGVARDSTYQNLLSQRLGREGFTVAQLERLWKVESGRRDWVIGKKGEIGRGQIKIETARIYSPKITKAELKDSVVNTVITIKHLSSLKSHFKSMGFKGKRLDLLTLSAYNRGLTNVLKSLSCGYSGINNYAWKIW